MEPPPLPTEDFHYWAFISYSSKDVKWGRWLHRAIETYGIPAQLTGQPTPTGHASPKRFHPLFRDRDELPASSDLGAKIEAALRVSRYLIVICSPNAAKSEWVNKEITTFQSMGRQGRILAIIVDGEPNAADARECFPPALRTFEPIAADARPVGDGKENAKLKLLAGMLGVGFDALKQRDAQRKIHRLQLVVAASSLVILSLAGMAWYSSHQRQKAIAARHQAEGILEYLIYDLRDKLEPLGHSSIIQGVQTRVEAYYRELGIERSDGTTLRNRAKALTNEGDLRHGRGDLVGAIEAYSAAVAILKPLTENEPDNPALLAELSVCHDRIGDELSAQNNPDGALASFRASLDLSRRLLALYPSDQDWQHNYALINAKIGGLLLQNNGNLSAAHTAFIDALNADLRVAAVDSSNPLRQCDLASDHDHIGDVLDAQGDLPAALIAFRQAFEIRKRLADSEPNNTGWQRNLAVSYNRIGDALHDQGDFAGALTTFQSALAIDQHLTAIDSTNTGWQRDLSVSHTKIGEVLHEQNDRPGALKAFSLSTAIRERLIAIEPSNADWRRDLSVAYFKTGDILREQGDLGGALQVFQKALAITRDLAGENRNSLSRQRDLSVSLNNVADVLRAQGELAEALKAYRESLAIRIRLAAFEPNNTRWQRDIASCYDRIGDTLRAQHEPLEALQCYRDVLAIMEDQAKNEATNAHKQRDLAICYVKLAALAEEVGKPDARGWWQKAYDKLSEMKQRGILLPTDEQDLEQLRQKLGQ